MTKENYQWTEFFPKFFNKIYNKTSEALYKEYDETTEDIIRNAGYQLYSYDFNRIDPLSFLTKIISYKKVWLVMKSYDETIDFHDVPQDGISSININKLEWWKEAYNNKNDKNKVSEIFSNLEEFAKQIYEDKIERDLFNIICEYKDNGLIKTSQLLSQVRPDKYFPLDEKMQSYANFSISGNEDCYEEFCRLQQVLREKFQYDHRKIYEISDDAHKNFLENKKITQKIF